jgi:hypothetical protein
VVAFVRAEGHDAHLHEQRREVERLLASKNECSPTLHRKGTELIRTHERLIDVAEAARQVVADHSGRVFDSDERLASALARLDGGDRGTA